jgi:hypothetical protein
MVVLLAASLVCAAWAGEEEKAEPQLRLELDLVDGSRIIGVPGIESVPVQTSYAKMEIPLKELFAIRMAADHETASLDLRNGDRLKGVMILKPVKLKTVFGNVSIGVEHIRGLRVKVIGMPLPEALSKKLVLSYSFDRDEGGTVRDASGKAGAGTVHGATWVADGVSGGAYDFDGKSSYISVAYDPASGLFPTTAPFSISAWFRIRASAPIQPTIVGTHMAGAGSGYMLCLDSSQNGRLRWMTVDGGQQGHYLWSKGSVNDGRWHHVVAAWDGSRISLHLDGALQGFQAAPELSYANRADFQIGHTDSIGGASGLSQYFFDGQIDEVMVFGGALSEDEVKLIHDIQK